MLLEKTYSLYVRIKKFIIDQLCSFKIRFPMYDRNLLKNIKLDEIGYFYSGLSGKTKKDFNINANANFITYKSIFDNNEIDINNLEKVNVNADEKQNKVKYNDLFFTMSSETPMEVGMVSVLSSEVEECYLNSFCCGYRLNNKEINPIFLSYYLRSPIIRKKIIKLAQGSTRFNLPKKEIEKLNIQLPSFDEQKKIADFIILIDNKLDKIKDKLENMKGFKKGMLNSLFI